MMWCFVKETIQLLRATTTNFLREGHVLQRLLDTRCPFVLMYVVLIYTATRLQMPIHQMLVTVNLFRSAHVIVIFGTKTVV